jgi:hypothetical protein
MLNASNMRYEMSARACAISGGGIRARHLLVQQMGLVEDFDHNRKLLKGHQPCHKSDRDLNIAHGILDCGVDVLNPIQPACPGMDMAELKIAFGARVIFHGHVDNQNVLPRGTAEDVRHETRDCLATLRAGREGFICCSCHNVQAGTRSKTFSP